MDETKKYRLIRFFGYRILIETFIIFAVVAILGIRLYLKLTDYPIIGNEYYHVSHMLWGGLCMSVAIIQFLIFLNPQSRYVASVLGGIGFGTFIDEVGKFVTRDNDYFFQPSFAIIYLIFISIFLLIHLLNRNHEFSEQEYLVNSIELMKEAAIHDLDSQEKALAISYLSKTGNNNTLVPGMLALYERIETINKSRRNIWTFARSQLIRMYLGLTAKRWFRRTIMLFFLIQAVLSLIVALFTLLERDTHVLPAFLLPTILSIYPLHSIHFYAAIIAMLFVMVGAMRIYHSRLRAFIMFKRSVLISMLIGEVFAFSVAPIRAFGMLIFHLVILTALNSMIDQERTQLALQKKQ